MPAVAALTTPQQRKAAALYKSGLSTQQVADHFGVSLDAAFYALRRQKVPRRTIQESNRLRFESKPLSYKINSNLSPQETHLKMAAIMLYWAEGYKVSKCTVDFANSDPAMALIFIKFLRQVCGVDEKRLRGHIYCYEGQNVEAITNYWSKLLAIPRNQFIKPYIKKAAALGPRGPRMIHGLVHVCYSDKKLLRQLLSWIAEYQQNLTK